MTWLREHWRQILVVAVIVGGFTALNRLLPSVDVESALHKFSDTVGVFAYGIAGAAAFLETGAFVGLVLPGETFVILAGAVAGQGSTSIWLTVVVVWVGAFAGDSTSFIIGRNLGREWALHHGARLGITHDRLATVERYFERYGGRTIVIGRFIGLVRALAPFIGGTSGMRYREYLPYGLAGTGLWSAVICLLGYFLSAHVNEAVHVAGRAAFWLGVAAAILVGVYLGARNLRRADACQRRRIGLTAAGIAAALGIAAVVALAFVAGSHPGPTGMDSSAFQAARDVRAGWLTSVAKVVTGFGSAAVTLPLALLAAVLLARAGRWREVVVLAVAVGLAQIAVAELKVIVDRPRPPNALVPTLNAAYPSGHSAQAVTYLWLAVLAGLRARAVVGAALVVGALLLVLAIGLTRVYLRAHFLTDVLGGWGVGVAAFAVPAGVALFMATRVGNNERDAAPAG